MIIRWYFLTQGRMKQRRDALERMKITVKRNTGFMGGASKIALKVDQQKVKALKNNEEVEVNIQGESAEVNANQWFFGSKGVKVAAGDSVEIQTNPTALLLFGIFVALLILSIFLKGIIIAGALLVCVLVVLFYSINNYYIVTPTSTRNKQ